MSMIPNEELHSLAQDIITRFSQQNPEHSQELLSAFVSELFLCATEQSQREFRRQKQAEGIAKAKARGVRFGTPRKPLPEKFPEACKLWQNKEMTLKEAADFCGMPRTSFYDAAKRIEKP